jgi:hypothetical protein
MIGFMVSELPTSNPFAVENKIGHELHVLFNALPRYHFPFHQHLPAVPDNGIYILFESGEKYETIDRIVRIGTHTGNNQLHSRIFQHFEVLNQRRSIFRKNIGRCLLNCTNDPYLDSWNLEFTSRADKERNAGRVDLTFEAAVEAQISQIIQQTFTFAAFQIESIEQRLFYEAKIIATIAHMKPSPTNKWLGNSSPVDKIRSSGLWQVQGLNSPKFTVAEFKEFAVLVNTHKSAGLKTGNR